MERRRREGRRARSRARCAREFDSTEGGCEGIQGEAFPRGPVRSKVSRHCLFVQERAIDMEALVGRTMEEKYQLNLPQYPGISQIVELPRTEDSQKL